MNKSLQKMYDALDMKYKLAAANEIEESYKSKITAHILNIFWLYHFYVWQWVLWIIQLLSIIPTLWVLCVIRSCINIIFINWKVDNVNYKRQRDILIKYSSLK